nr:uncharacterized mitochondrial protein AtMg00810-like [Tanacetum cinerariifolium]
MILALLFGLKLVGFYFPWALGVVEVKGCVYPVDLMGKRRRKRCTRNGQEREVTGEQCFKRRTGINVLLDYKAEYKKMKAKLALLEASPSRSQNPKTSQLKNRGLVIKTFNWEEEEVSDDEEVTQVKVLMALVDYELIVRKSHARNGEWVDITIRKVNTVLFMDEDADWKNYLKYINIDLKFVEEQRLKLLSKTHHSFTSPKYPLGSFTKLRSNAIDLSIPISKGDIRLRLDDCRNYLKCEIYRSYDHFTLGNNHVIQVKGGVLAGSSQSNESSIGVKCDTRRSTVHSTTDHNQIDHFKREDEISIDDSSRYPPNEFVHKDDPSRQYQIDSDISYYLIPHGRSLSELTQENQVPEVIALNEPDIPHTEDTEGPPYLINTEGTPEQYVQNDQMITQSTNVPSGDNTKVSRSLTESLVPDVTQSHILNQASTSSHPILQDRWSRDQYLKLMNIIGDPGESMLTRSMDAKLTAASASECLFADFLSEIEPKRYQSNPKESYLTDVKIILKYLKGTPTLGLYYPKGSGFDLKEHSDSYYDGCNMDRKSTSGVCQMLGGKLVFLSAKKQQSVAKALVEAEYVVAAGCCTSILWMKSQLSDYDIHYKMDKDKGNEIMVEPEKPLKKKDQIALDEEVARNLEAQMKAKIEKEERIAREKDEANIAVIEERDDVQATIDADRELAEQVQAQEREQLSIKERSKLLVKLIESRRKYFAAKRAEEIKNKPPIKAQQKKESLKKTQAEVTKGSSKRAGDEIEQESAKRQRLEKEDDSAELKRCLEIVPKDDDDVTIEATPLSSKSPTIVDYKIYKEGKKSYFRIIRADGNSQNYLTFGKMFKNFNKEDLEVL